MYNKQTLFESEEEPPLRDRKPLTTYLNHKQNLKVFVNNRDSPKIKGTSENRRLSL